MKEWTVMVYMAGNNNLSDDITVRQKTGSLRIAETIHRETGIIRQILKTTRRKAEEWRVTLRILVVPKIFH